MTELAALSPDAAGYLRDSEDGGIPHMFWASYAFPGRRFDHVTSNLSEIASSALRLHRELPPLQLLVAVYNYEMGHFYDRLQKATAWKDILAPHPHSLFVEALQHCRKLNCTPASENTGLVRGSTGKEYNVKLAADGKGGSSMREPVAAFCSRCGEPDHTARQCRTAH
ncbi:hypothetical protein A4X09_0g7827 [Tilletia walkeri]|uniref:CCHC-type domain-containing protein n=1 Tax=Tilletia walkeri TaxID=117179 RepID=A0A8X7N2I8_9BASI|nr:hypothetical protein A4X09_0g7827 [Tilletia walkeri]